MEINFLQILVTGLFNGIGTGIGSYLAVKHAVTHSERLFKKVKGYFIEKVKRRN